MSRSLTHRYLALYEQGRMCLTAWLEDVTEGDLPRRLHPEASAGLRMLRHIDEVELLFARNVFERMLEVKAHTIGPSAGRRQAFGSADEQRAHLERSGRALCEAIAAQEEDDDWTREVTADFGTLPLQEALARIITHTAYHVGQARLTLKYGTSS